MDLRHVVASVVVAGLAFAGAGCTSSTGPRTSASSSEAHGSLPTTSAGPSGAANSSARKEPRTSLPAGLVSVACPSSRECIAVGGRGRWSWAGGGSGIYDPLAYELSSGRWRAMPLPNSGLLGGEMLVSVACPTTRFCVAVGDSAVDANRPVLLRWNGAHWALTPASVPENAQLTGLSCHSVGDCYAVGGRVVGLGLLIEHWNGTKWMTSASRGAPGAELTAVSCGTSDSCTAVGGSYVPGPRRCSSSIYRLGRGGWGMQVPADAILVCSHGGPWLYTLDAVSCTGASRCIAVGQWEYHMGIEIALAEASQGTRWTLQRFPGGIGRKFSFAWSPIVALGGVSCASSEWCMAAGGTTPSTAVGPSACRVGDTATACPFAAVWKGSKWQRLTMPQVAGAAYLQAVSCSNESHCVAVGAEDASPGFEIGSFDGDLGRPLAEVWDGWRWRAMSFPAG